MAAARKFLYGGGTISNVMLFRIPVIGQRRLQLRHAGAQGEDNCPPFKLVWGARIYFHAVRLLFVGEALAHGFNSISRALFIAVEDCNRYILISAGLLSPTSQSSRADSACWITRSSASLR